MEEKDLKQLPVSEPEQCHGITPPADVSDSNIAEVTENELAETQPTPDITQMDQVDTDDYNVDSETPDKSNLATENTTSTPYITSTGHLDSDHVDADQISDSNSVNTNKRLLFLELEERYGRKLSPDVSDSDVAEVTENEMAEIQHTPFITQEDQVDTDYYNTDSDTPDKSDLATENTTSTPYITSTGHVDTDHVDSDHIADSDSVYTNRRLVYLELEERYGRQPPTYDSDSDIAEVAENDENESAEIQHMHFTTQSDQIDTDDYNIDSDTPDKSDIATENTTSTPYITSTGHVDTDHIADSDAVDRRSLVSELEERLGRTISANFEDRLFGPCTLHDECDHEWLLVSELKRHLGRIPSSDISSRDFSDIAKVTESILDELQHMPVRTHSSRMDSDYYYTDSDTPDRGNMSEVTQNVLAELKEKLAVIQRAPVDTDDYDADSDTGDRSNTSEMTQNILAESKQKLAVTQRRRVDADYYDADSDTGDRSDVSITGGTESILSDMTQTPVTTHRGNVDTDDYYADSDTADLSEVAMTERILAEVQHGLVTARRSRVDTDRFNTDSETVDKSDVAMTQHTMAKFMAELQRAPVIPQRGRVDTDHYNAGSETADKRHYGQCILHDKCDHEWPYGQCEEHGACVHKLPYGRCGIHDNCRHEWPYGKCMGHDKCVHNRIYGTCGIHDEWIPESGHEKSGESDQPSFDTCGVHDQWEHSQLDGDGAGAGLDGDGTGAGLDGDGAGAGLDGDGAGAGLDGDGAGAGLDGDGTGAGLDGEGAGAGDDDEAGGDDEAGLDDEDGLDAEDGGDGAEGEEDTTEGDGEDGGEDGGEDEEEDDEYDDSALDWEKWWNGIRGGPLTGAYVPVALIHPLKCKPAKCKLQCSHNCPVNLTLKQQCIHVKVSSFMAYIDEHQCRDDGACVRVCPYGAIKVGQKPRIYADEMSHRYGRNMFQLNRLTVPERGSVTGVLGPSKSGKSLLLRVLGGKIVPNFGYYEAPPKWPDVLKMIAGTKLHEFLEPIANQEILSVIKTQQLSLVKDYFKGPVRRYLRKLAAVPSRYDEVVKLCGMERIIARNVNTLSPGEIQRFCIAVLCVQKKPVTLFDEPSTFLDLRAKLMAANAIADCVEPEHYVVVADQDLCFMDFVSDSTILISGEPSVFGVVNKPCENEEALYSYMVQEKRRACEQHLPTPEDLLSEKRAGGPQKIPGGYSYPNMAYRRRKFKMQVEGGKIRNGKIIVVMGENGCGKSTFLDLLAGKITVTTGDRPLKITSSYKQQVVKIPFGNSVSKLFKKNIPKAFADTFFQEEVLKPLNIPQLYHDRIPTLTPNELQRVALAMSLGHCPDLFLIDEPCTHLDAFQRIAAARAIRHVVQRVGRPAIVVEHDILATYLMADKVVAFEGKASFKTLARAPMKYLTGINFYLEQMGVTCWYDRNVNVVRMNRIESHKDKKQKKLGLHFRGPGRIDSESDDEDLAQESHPAGADSAASDSMAPVAETNNSRTSLAKANNSGAVLAKATNSGTSLTEATNTETSAKDTNSVTS